MIPTRDRIIVAQPRRDHAALPTGVLHWFHGMDALTVIVKGTFSYADSDTLVLCGEQEPLTIDRPSELAPAELMMASDFVPRKSAVDVLLYGHAHAVQATTRIDARIALGEMQRSFCVVSDREQSTIALTDDHLRDRNGEMTPPVGPAFSIALLEPVVDDADSADIYMSAVPMMRCGSVAAGDVIELMGLSARGKRRLRLPSMQPVLTAPALAEIVPQLMTCDTVWLDTDNERCVLVWRAAFDTLGGVEQLTLGFVDGEGDLARGHFFYAAQRHDLSSEPKPDTDEADRLRMARYETLADIDGPQPSITLERYAIITAELAEQREPREDVLARHGFDEDAWLLEERGWLERMAGDALTGDATVAAQFGDLFVEAQGELARPEEHARTLSDWVTISVAIERAEDVSQALFDHDLTLAEWLRLDKRWRTACIADDALEAQRSELLAKLRGAA